MVHSRALPPGLQAEFALYSVLHQVPVFSFTDLETRAGQSNALPMTIQMSTARRTIAMPGGRSVPGPFAGGLALLTLVQ